MLRTTITQEEVTTMLSAAGQLPCFSNKRFGKQSIEQKQQEQASSSSCSFPSKRNEEYEYTSQGRSISTDTVDFGEPEDAREQEIAKETKTADRISHGRTEEKTYQQVAAVKHSLDMFANEWDSTPMRTDYCVGEATLPKFIGA